MKKKILKISLLFSAVLLFITILFYSQSQEANSKDSKSQQILAVNEIEQLAKKGDFSTLAEKSRELQDSLSSAKETTTGNKKYFIIGGICILYIFVLFGYVYFSILQPFDKMKAFAKKIAQGNFDVPLDYERSNYFGDFTWAFDSMRREITKARACEKEAAENNKTVIATLSHDIKTPIASIRAYAEGLEANMDTSHEKREKYLTVLMKKCDEVSTLTNDLFLHSVSDLDRLEISPKKLEICTFMKNMAEEISAGQKDIKLILPQKEIFVFADKNRLMQICENLINNARKYAKTEIAISLSSQEEFLKISFRDYGKGIPDEDMPFICSKFYRGKNCGQEQGSGLGLYIVKYITEKMEGKFLLHNHADGLEAVVFLPVKKDRITEVREENH